MFKQDLGGTWNLDFGEYHCEGRVPGSVYSLLLDAGLMEDPFYRDNEQSALAVMDSDFVLSRTFTPDAEILSDKRAVLRCEGLDTVCEVFLNGKSAGSADNMHRTWEYEVSGLLLPG
ncbi:MAG: glycoside hydrolase family 2 protein, partial [Oscillospiraceae bacterium]|nr:glycoside hydrolase family 2 protein [Oscillospiraceae bacterium]